MQFSLEISGNINNLMRQAGYHPEEGNGKTDELSFARRLAAADFPRFHIYLKSEEVSPEISRQVIEINLHLDQKGPIYRGVRAHSGEYEGELVEKEAKRIKEIAGL